VNNPHDKQGYFDHILKLNERIGDGQKYSIKVPVELCQFVLRQKMLPAFKIYLLLKMTTSGKCRLEKWDKIMYSEFCGYTSFKSFDNNLKNLRSLNWLGYNERTCYYFIRSFASIQKQHQLLKSRTGFWFAIQDMQDFDGVIYGAFIGYLSKHQGKLQRADQKNGRSNQTLCKSPGFYPVANRALAKILNISVSTASMMKRRAEEEGAIEVIRKRIVTPATYSSFRILQTHYSDEILKPILWKSKFYQRFPDLVRANLKYGMRKKIDQ